MVIRKAKQSDRDAIWAMLEPVLRAGETYTLPRTMSRDEALAYWYAPAHRTFIAEDEGQISGTYYMRDNQAGPGNHVCNCGYVVAAQAGGKGVATALNKHSLETARAHGYKAMQYNAVVSTNLRAIALWKRCGFEILAAVPGAFLHPQNGYVDAYIMHRNL